MQERAVLGRTTQEIDEKINRDLLGNLFSAPPRFWIVVIFLAVVVATAMGAVGYMVANGLGTTGLNRPIMWGFFITNFVFWVGISHAGVMLSAILRLAQGRVAAPRHESRGSRDDLLAVHRGHLPDPAYGPPVAHALLGVPLRLRPGASGPTSAHPWSGTPRPSGLT